MSRLLPSRRHYGLLLAALFLAGAGARAQQGDTAGSAARRASTMRLEAGDRIAIHVAGEPLFTDTVMVSERGQAPFPKLGVLEVGQLSISALEDTLRARYAQYLRNPALEIVVLRRIAVNGEVKNPDVYLVDVTTTLRDVIARAGGITENGHTGRVYLVRDGQRTLVKNWERDQTSASDLRSGDQVLVGRRSWWAINALPAVSTAVLVASVIITARR